MTIESAALDVLSGVSTATITTVLLKKGLRNVWMRGTQADPAGPVPRCWPGIHTSLRPGARGPRNPEIVVLADLHPSRDRSDA